MSNTDSNDTAEASLLKGIGSAFLAGCMYIPLEYGNVLANVVEAYTPHSDKKSAIRLILDKVEKGVDDIVLRHSNGERTTDGEHNSDGEFIYDDGVIGTSAEVVAFVMGLATSVVAPAGLITVAATVQFSQASTPTSVVAALAPNHDSAALVAASAKAAGLEFAALQIS